MALKKPVSFGENKRDQELLNYANTKLSFSIYVKGLIKEDMEKNKKTNSGKTEKKGLNFDF